MALCKFTVWAEIEADHGVKENELVLTTAEHIVDVVAARAVDRKVKGYMVEQAGVIVANTMPTVIPPDAQQMIRERRHASMIAEINKG